MVLLDWRKPFDKACHDILVDKMWTRVWGVLWGELVQSVPRAGINGPVRPRRWS